MINQHERIMNYMRDHGSITPMEAFTELGITKLSTRIGEMILKGKTPIYKEMQAVKRADGTTVRYMKYYIK